MRNARERGARAHVPRASSRVLATCCRPLLSTLFPKRSLPLVWRCQAASAALGQTNLLVALDHRECQQDLQLSRHISPQPACSFFACVHVYLGPHPRRDLVLEFLHIQQTGRTPILRPLGVSLTARSFVTVAASSSSKTGHHLDGMCSGCGVAWHSHHRSSPRPSQ